MNRSDNFQQVSLNSFNFFSIDRIDRVVFIILVFSLIYLIVLALRGRNRRRKINMDIGLLILTFHLWILRILLFFLRQRFFSFLLLNSTFGFAFILTQVFLILSINLSQFTLPFSPFILIFVEGIWFVKKIYFFEPPYTIYRLFFPFFIFTFQQSPSYFKSFHPPI